jgi:hypothetical protein
MCDSFSPNMLHAPPTHLDLMALTTLSTSVRLLVKNYHQNFTGGWLWEKLIGKWKEEIMAFCDPRPIREFASRNWREPRKTLFTTAVESKMDLLNTNQERCSLVCDSGCYEEESWSLSLQARFLHVCYFLSFISKKHLPRHSPLRHPWYTNSDFNNI